MVSTPKISDALTKTAVCLMAVSLWGGGCTEPTRQVPGPRFGHALSYEGSREQVILFGGAGLDRTPLGDTWVWDGQSWKRIATEGPSPRSWPTMAYDSKRDRVILFGGRGRTAANQESMGDTWAWDGHVWSQLADEGPPARDHHTMVYDRHRDRIILFGGWNYQQRTPLGDTWEFDGEYWRKVAGNGPDPRAAHGMAFDPQRREIVLFGGRTLEEFFGDTWVWSDGGWAQRQIPGPPARAFQGMAPDPEPGKMLLFGGRYERTLMADTWKWDGIAWEKVSDSGPSERGVYSVVLDESRAQVLLYGGGDRAGDKWNLHADTWLWDGIHWELRD